MTAVTQQIGNWVSEFSKWEPQEPWIQQLREAAFQRFSELGFPTTHDEEWRFTNVAPIARTKFISGRKGVVAAKIGKQGIQLVFSNGHLVNRPGSLPKGLQAGGFSADAVAVQQNLGRY